MGGYGGAFSGIGNVPDQVVRVLERRNPLDTVKARRRRMERIEGYNCLDALAEMLQYGEISKDDN